MFDQFLQLDIAYIWENVSIPGREHRSEENSEEMNPFLVMILFYFKHQLKMEIGLIEKKIKSYEIWRTID